jgi:hypothetical protein
MSSASAIKADLHPILTDCDIDRSFARVVGCPNHLWRGAIAISAAQIFLPVVYSSCPDCDGAADVLVDEAENHAIAVTSAH